MARLTHSLFAVCVVSAQFVAAVPAHESSIRYATLDNRSPQLGDALTTAGGGLSSTLGGAGNLVGGLVSGLGGLLGNTVGGLVSGVGNLLGLGYKPAPNQAPPVQPPPPQPRPQPPARPPPPQQPQESDDLTITIIDAPVLCRKYPDLLVSSNVLDQTRTYNPGKTLKAKCRSAPSLLGNPAGDTAWVKTKDNCYISELEQTFGVSIRKKLVRCGERLPQHWAGLLQSGQSAYCYEEPRLDAPSQLQGPPTTDPTKLDARLSVKAEKPGARYVDLGCSVTGEVAAGSGDSLWYRSVAKSRGGRDCYFPNAIFDQGEFIGNITSTCSDYTYVSRAQPQPPQYRPDNDVPFDVAV